MQQIPSLDQLQTTTGRLASFVAEALNIVADAIADIEITDTHIELATNSSNGLMSAEDKAKLDSIELTNNFTSEDKTKLDGIASNAQVNVIETVKVNNTALSVTNKAVNIDLSGYLKTSGKAASATTADSAGNVTGTVAIANGGTGATAVAGARQNLFPNAMNTSALAKYVITINDSYVSGGYTTLQQLRNFMGLGDTTGVLPVANGGTGQSALANVTGVGSALKVQQTLGGTNVADLLYSQIADNDYFRIRVGGTASNAGFAELATADDGNEPIYVRQYTGVFYSLVRTATLLDASGNTSFPGIVTASSFVLTTTAQTTEGAIWVSWS